MVTAYGLARQTVQLPSRKSRLVGKIGVIVKLPGQFPFSRAAAFLVAAAKKRLDFSGRPWAR
jgi:hypothetical protein